MAIRNSNLESAQNSQNPGDSIKKEIRSDSILNWGLLIGLIGLVVFGANAYFQQGTVLKHTAELEDQVKQVQSKIDALRNNKVEVSQNAAQALQKIQSNEIRWSEVIENVDKLVPSDNLGRDVVEILSYSGSGTGKIALNMLTMPATLPPFETVSLLLSTFNNSVFFKNAYVPSISKGRDVNGAYTLSFVMNLDYIKPETGSENLIVPQAVTTNTPKVSTPKISTNN